MRLPNHKLVAHFGNSLAALNTPSLREQLLALPAVALEALLESDEFGTDDEASVLLMLAMWMCITEWMWTNRDKAEPAVRQRLCRTVRLAHLSRPYLSLILPALAADHEKDPEAPAGWFSGASVLEAAAVANFACAAAREKEIVLSAAVKLPALSGSLKASPRPQCIPPSGGLTFSWHIPKEHLLQTVRQLQPGSVQRVYGAFDHNPDDGVFARGFEWRVHLQLTGGQSTAGVFLQCDLPTTWMPFGSRLRREATVTSITSVPISASLVVHRRQGAAVRDVKRTFSPEAFVKVGTGRGWSTLLPLQDQQQQQDAAAAAAVAAAAAAAANPLAAWVEYLTDGKVSGTLTLLRPSP